MEGRQLEATRLFQNASVGLRESAVCPNRMDVFHSAGPQTLIPHRHMLKHRHSAGRALCLLTTTVPPAAADCTEDTAESVSG